MSDTMSRQEIILSLQKIDNRIDNHIAHNDSVLLGIKEDVNKANERMSCIEKVQQAEAVHKAEFEMEVSTKLDNILENQAIKEERLKTSAQNNTAIKVAVIAATASFMVGLLSLIKSIFF